MMCLVKIEEVGDMDFFIDEQVDCWCFQEENDWVIVVGGELVVGQFFFFGIIKVLFFIESWFFVVSFQEMMRVFIEVVIFGKIDFLFGFKENVIVGCFILVGIGMQYYYDFYMEEDVYEIESEVVEELFFEFGDDDICIMLSGVFDFMEQS